MISLALLALSAMQRRPVDRIVLQFIGREFIARQGSKSYRAPITPIEPRPRTTIEFRRNNTYAVWDKRGLTIRAGKSLLTTRLEKIAVSPRIYARPEIRRNLALFAQHKRSKFADALSGAYRLGTSAYFLARWDEPSGAPWLEALIKVDLAASKPEPILLGRLDGLSTATLPIDDRLFPIDGAPSAIVRREDQWGLSQFDLRTRAAKFRPMGSELYDLLPEPSLWGLFVERAPYGATVIGSANFRNGYRKILAETQGPARFIDRELPAIALVQSVDGLAIRDLESGCEIPFSDGSVARRAGSLIVIWAPAKQPQTATVYNPERWTPLATWTAAQKSTGLR